MAHRKKRAERREQHAREVEASQNTMLRRHRQECEDDDRDEKDDD